MQRLIAVLFLLILSGSVLARDNTLKFEIKAEKQDRKAIETNIRALLSPSFGKDKASLERYFRHVRNQTDRALTALGYYHYDLSHELKQKSAKKSQLIVEIDPGEPVRIGEVSIRTVGPLNKDHKITLPEKIMIHPGEQLNHGRYEALKKYYLSLAINQGYLDAKLTRNELQINLATNRANIYLELNSGERYYLGETSLGPSKMRNKFLKRYITYDKGSAYTSDKLQKLNLDLQQSGYFKAVRVTADPEKAENHVVPVSVEFVDRKRNRIDLGGGYSTDLGLNGEIEWKNMRLNGMGDQVGADYSWSNKKSSVSAYYIAPLQHPQTDYFKFSVGWQQEDIEDTRTTQGEFGPEVTLQLPSSWLQTISLTRLYEDYSIGSTDYEAAQLTIPGLRWSRRVMDNKIDPDDAFSTNLTLKFTTESLISTTAFGYVLLNTRAITTPIKKNRFTARFQVGTIITDDFDGIPPSLRFYAGGDQSVRGYSYRTVSPKNSDGDILGGSQIMTGSLEYAYEFIPDWRLALFTDHGSAFNSWSNRNGRTSVGTGIRWVSPIGQVRLDFAAGIDEDLTDISSYRIHISMGPDI